MGKEGASGLLRNDLSEKPSFRAIKNLITILSDKGPDFPSGALNYTVNGTMDNVRQILFQKRNGDFYLMVWLEVSSWDFNTQIDLYPPPQQVVLTLQDNNRISSAILYAFNNSGYVNAVSLTINNNQVTFNITDKITILKLGNTFYQLRSKSALHSCLESNSNQNEVVIIQSSCRNTFHQQWLIEPIDSDFYRVINRASGRILGIDDDCKLNHTRLLQLNDWLDSDCQKWKFELLPDNHHRIRSKHVPHQCFDVHHSSSTDDTKVQQLSYLEADSQYRKLQ